MWCRKTCELGSIHSKTQLRQTKGLNEVNTCFRCDRSLASSKELSQCSHGNKRLYYPPASVGLGPTRIEENLFNEEAKSFLIGFVCLLLLYVLAASKVITGRLPPCDSVHSWQHYSVATLVNQARPNSPLSQIFLTLSQPGLALS